MNTPPAFAELAKIRWIFIKKFLRYVYMAENLGKMQI